MFTAVGVVQRNGAFYLTGIVLMGGSCVPILWRIVLTKRDEKEKRNRPIATVVEDNVIKNECCRCHGPLVTDQEPAYGACMTCGAVFHLGACIQLHVSETGHQTQDSGDSQ
jgi:hypothetical protein